VVQELLGRSSIVLTADAYTSVLPARQIGRPHHRRRARPR
jgi:site-specific recombinase XerD